MQLMVSGTGRRIVATAGVVAVAAAGAVIARADQQPDVQAAQAVGGLSVTPVTIERTAAVGAANTIKVANNSRETLTVAVTPRPWTQSSSGLVSPNRRRTLDALAVTEKSFTLAPGASKEFTLTLRSAPAGGALYGALEIIGLPRDVAKRKGVVTGYRLLGPLRYNPTARTYNLTASSAKVTGSGSKRVMSVAVRSTGNTADAVTGSVRVRGPLGTRQGTIKPTRILPGKTVRLALTSARGLAAGSYTATATLQQGTKRFIVSKRIRVRR